MACFYAAVLGVYYREMTWDRVSATLKEIVDVSIPALFILAAANLFSWIIAIEQIPQIAAAVMLGITQNKYLILLIINILLLFVGCFLPPIPAMILLIPVFSPLMQKIGVDPIHPFDRAKPHLSRWGRGRGSG